MENLNVKETKELNKHEFFNKYKNLFKIISITLGNVIFEYQLKDFMFVTKAVKTESQYQDFLSKCKKHELLKEEVYTGSNKIVYVAKNYVIQNVTHEKRNQYKYSDADALVSYYKMFYILETIKPRLEYLHKIAQISQVLLHHTTMHIGKSQHFQLYKALKDRKILDINGEIMMNDLEYYDISKSLNLKDKYGNYKNEKLRKIMSDEISKQKFEDTCYRIKGNKNFWDYNLGKISDNKSFFIFYNPINIDGYKMQSTGTLDIVKFDTSDTFGNAELGDYITKVLSSLKAHVNQDYKHINLYVYYSNEDRKKDIFNHSIQYKVNRNGVTNLDSNLTARIKETSRRVYQNRTITFSDAKVDTNTCIASFNVHYSSKNYNPDDFYNVTIHFANVDYQNDIFSKEEQEQARIKAEEMRLQKEVDKYAKDPVFLELLRKRLIELQKNN